MFTDNLCYKVDIQITFTSKICIFKVGMGADDERKSRLMFDEDYE